MRLNVLLKSLDEFDEADEVIMLLDNNSGGSYPSDFSEFNADKRTHDGKIIISNYWVMKANAPEKIYRTTTYLDNDRGKTLWKKAPVAGAENIEYARTDAFMKKAKEAFCKATCNGLPSLDICTSLGTCRDYDNFVKYIRGE